MGATKSRSMVLTNAVCVDIRSLGGKHIYSVERISPVSETRFPRVGFCCWDRERDTVFTACESRTPVALMELYSAVMSPWDRARGERWRCGQMEMGKHRGGLTGVCCCSRRLSYQARRSGASSAVGTDRAFRKFNILNDTVVLPVFIEKCE